MKKNNTFRHSNKKSKNTTKRIFFTPKKYYRGGRDSSNVWETENSTYPHVYGLDNKAVLFPVSDYGVPGGFFDPPVPSNGPNGNGQINGLYLGGMRKRSKNKHSKNKHSKNKHSKNKHSKNKRMRSRSMRSRSMRSRSKNKRMRSRSMRSRNKTYKKRHAYRGGGSQGTLAPQSLVNLTRSLTGSVQETLNGFSGRTNSASLNPMPYDQVNLYQQSK